METDNIDFKKIWDKQETNIPEIKDLYKEINNFKRNNLYKLIFINILLLITSIIIGFIWYYYQPQLKTTKIGIVLTILAIFIFIIIYNKQIPLLSKTNIEFNNKDYIQHLIKLKEKQVFQQKTMLSLYFIMLSLGIGLYLFEYVSKMTLNLGIVFYSLTGFWIAINWFYFRPKVIRRQNHKLNTLLLKIKEVKNQI